MIKCGVCGSENEAEALFCGTCGSPLTPAETKQIVEDATKVAPPDAPTGDEAVVPGKGGARRDLGTGGPGTGPVMDRATPTPPEAIVDDTEALSTGPTITCGVCGTVNDASRTYCRKCANELKPAPPPPPEPAAPPPPRRISPILLGLGAAGVVVALGIIVVLALSGPGASPSPSQAATNQPATIGPSDTETPTDEPQATPEALAGSIVWNGGEGQDRDLYRANADGSSGDAEPLTSLDGYSRDPSADPTGEQLVFSTFEGLKTMRLSDLSPEEFTTFPADKNAVWSPTGDFIVFAGKRGDSGSDFEIRLQRIGDSASIALTDNDLDDEDPVVTLDGSAVIYVEGKGSDSRLMRIDVPAPGDDPGDPEPLTDDDSTDLDPTISPDGERVVFISDRAEGEFSLFSFPLSDPSAIEDLAPEASLPDDPFDPRFSPGGRYIVFFAGRDDETIYIFDAEAPDPSDPFEEFGTDTGRNLQPIWLP